MATGKWIPNPEPRITPIYICNHRDCVAVAGVLKEDKTPMKPPTEESEQNSYSRRQATPRRKRKEEARIHTRGE